MVLRKIYHSAARQESTIIACLLLFKQNFALLQLSSFPIYPYGVLGFWGFGGHLGVKK